MELSKEVSLQSYNSFNITAISPTVYFLNELTDLEQLPDLTSKPFYILGEGSNTLFVDHLAPIIIKPNFKGVDIVEKNESYIVTVASGENWHELVNLCIEQEIYGLENLALIPGSVGAAPVQNIGAYGVDFSDFCVEVKWFDFINKRVKTLSNQECNFSYRNSIFKQALYNKGIITEVVLSFPKKWQANLSYAGLNDLEIVPSARQVMEKVISLRSAKLPDPNVLANAGSFFKNPIINENKLTDLLRVYPNIPSYRQQNGQVKIAAGWLIEQAGLKGYCSNGVGVHQYQALVLVNYSSNDGKEIVNLAQYVQQQVLIKFDILLSPEVRMVSAQGEKSFDSLLVKDERV